jgi:hypothetical protein
METFSNEPEVLNEELVQAIVDAPDGHLKNASALSGRFIRRRIRENGFQRLILPFEDVKPSDLTPSLTSELPHIVEEMEGDQPGAVSLNYNDSPDTTFFRGDKFAMYFYEISTPEFTKNVFELMTYKSDVRGIVTGNMLKDIHTREDANFMAQVERIVGSYSGVGATGQQQHFENTGTISDRASYIDNLSHFDDFDLNNGTFLVNRKTAREFLKFNRTEIGGDTAEKLFMDGLDALVDFKLFGVPHISTIKKTLVPNWTVYKFAEPNFLGRAYRLQDITSFVKKEKNILRFSATEVIATTIANVAAVSRTTYTGY